LGFQFRGFLSKFRFPQGEFSHQEDSFEGSSHGVFVSFSSPPVLPALQATLPLWRNFSILLLYLGETMIKNLKRLPVPLLLMCGLFVCALLVWALPVAAEDRMAKDGDKVSIHYTGKLEDKTVFDTSENRAPLEFTVGDKKLIVGMNNAVRGMKVGESKTVTIPQEEAYGPISDKLVFEVPTKNLPPGIKAGTPLRDPQGNMVMVKEVNGEKSLLDANHILAGKTLIFDIKLVSIE